MALTSLLTLMGYEWDSAILVGKLKEGGACPELQCLIIISMALVGGSSYTCFSIDLGFRFCKVWGETLQCWRGNWRKERGDDIHWMSCNGAWSSSLYVSTLVLPPASYQGPVVLSAPYQGRRVTISSTSGTHWTTTAQHDSLTSCRLFSMFVKY